jgi:pyruvate-formate lyase-activating enzyme
MRPESQGHVLTGMEKALRVVIVFPQVGYCTGYRPHLERSPQYGATYHVAQCLPYLYSIARHFTDEVKVIDFNYGEYASNMAMVKAFEPDAMLLSSTVNSWDSTQQITQEIHQCLPDTKLFIGGPAVTANYTRRAKLLRVDAPCTFVVTARDIFAWTEQVFGVRSPLTFATFEPNYTWLSDTYGDQLFKLRQTVTTSLGCTYTCNFCLNHSEYSLEYKDPEVFRREIIQLRKLYGIDRVSVSDPYFFMKFRHADEIMRIFVEEEFDWAMQTTLVSMTDENIQKLQKARCKSVLVGIENFFSEEIDKPVTAEGLEHCINFANDHGIKIKPSFIVGLLDIDVETDVKHIHYIRSLIDRNLVENNQIQANVYTPYIPDERDRILDVPFRFWGVMPISVKDQHDWRDKLRLCDMVYEYIYPETIERYAQVKQDYFGYANHDSLPWWDTSKTSARASVELHQIKRKVEKAPLSASNLLASPVQE